MTLATLGDPSPPSSSFLHRPWADLHNDDICIHHNTISTWGAVSDIELCNPNDACVIACSYYLAPKIEDDEEMEDNA